MSNYSKRQLKNWIGNKRAKRKLKRILSILRIFKIKQDEQSNKHK